MIKILLKELLIKSSVQSKAPVINSLHTSQQTAEATDVKSQQKQPTNSLTASPQKSQQFKLAWSNQ